MRQPCTYILTNRSNQLFYIGVTSDIAAQMMPHRSGERRLVNAFTPEWNDLFDMILN